ncbi:UrcA family protein [Phenylobacterium immobile]|uniref:UrcA family protein n=1 Tax=Phenylobacterium immobile TaxID=21 RepID=UPI000ABA44D4|nr:UrcA family protein [Phenylobacterium immobile]
MRRTPVLTAAAALCLAAPAFAQAVNEVTVMGHYAGQGEKPMSISRVVSYADLDLSRSKDMDILKQRVRYTARRICAELGEAPTNQANLDRSCQDTAVREALMAFQPNSAENYAVPASAVVTNGPVPDTRQNRAAYGGPLSHAGRSTAARGN